MSSVSRILRHFKPCPHSALKCEDMFSKLESYCKGNGVQCPRPNHIGTLIAKCYPVVKKKQITQDGKRMHHCILGYFIFVRRFSRGLKSKAFFLYSRTDANEQTNNFAGVVHCNFLKEKSSKCFEA